MTDLTRITILDVAILDQTIDQIDIVGMIDLDVIVRIDQIEIDQDTGPGQTEIPDHTLDQILDQTLGTDPMTDPLQLTTVPSHTKIRLNTILVGMTGMRGQDMTNTQSHMTSLLIKRMTSMVEITRVIDQATIKIETKIVLERTTEIKIRPTIIEVILELLVTEASLEIDPTADLGTETGLDVILTIMLEVSLETSLEINLETSLEINHGAEKDPLRLTPLWR